MGQLIAKFKFLGFFSLMFLFLFSACATSNKAQQLGPLVDFKREIILVFETAVSFQPVKGATVKIYPKQPSSLVGAGEDSSALVTDSYGAVYFYFKTPAQYDEAVLKAGDLVVDYPLEFEYILNSSLGQFSGTIKENESLAVYQDPLYQGLNRTPNQSPLYINILLP